MSGVTFGNKHSYTDFNIYLTDVSIGLPTPVRYKVDVPGANGSLDMTDNITPHIRYKNRNIKLSFKYAGEFEDWIDQETEIADYLHGKRMRMILDDDEDYYWDAFCTIDTFKSDRRIGTLVINCDCFPYKYYVTENSYTVNGNGTITCVVDRMEISPAFELTAPTTVIYGDSSYVIESTATTEKTLSGDIVSFVDGTANSVVDLTADVTAVQDLNGYDHPWVGGAGVNLFGGIVIERLLDDETTSTSGSDWHTPKYYVNGATALTLKIYENPSYTSGSVGLITFDSNGTKIQSTNFIVTTQVSSYPYTTTLTLTGSPSYFYIRGYQAGGASGINSMKAQVERGSTATDYQPYENICPISGWDEVNVNRIGKNWCNKNGDLVLGFWLTTGGVPSITANTSNIAFNYKIPIPKGQSLTLSANTSINNFGYCTFQADETYINRVNNNNTSSVTIASASFDRYALVWVNRNNVAFSSLDSAREWLLSAEIQFEYGTQRTEFVSDGQTYTTDLNGTRYGGTLDVTTGVLTVTHGSILVTSASDFGDFGVGTKNANARITLSQNLPFVPSAISQKNGAISSTGLENPLYWASKRPNETPDNGDMSFAFGTNGILRFYQLDTSINTLDAFKASFPNTFIVYELATPQVVQLTPQQIYTLLNENNIWTDTGDTDMTYLAQDFAGRKFFIPDLELTEGSHSLTIQGTGTTKVTYTNGRL